MLKGSLAGIQYYLTPKFDSLLNIKVWNAAASQIFFSLGPGFGVLLALSSYNKFRNNCYGDAMLTSFINCATSFLSGFVVFSVLGHMCYRMKKEMSKVANEGKLLFNAPFNHRRLIKPVVSRRSSSSLVSLGPSLVFIAYPEAIATLSGSTFWAIIFMLMLITLGLDSTFGGLEAIITGILDRWPKLRRRRELVVLIMVIYCFLGALPTTTNGGYYVLTLLDTYGAPFSILFIVFCECVALCWCYGKFQFVKQSAPFTQSRDWFVCPTDIYRPASAAVESNPPTPYFAKYSRTKGQTLSELKQSYLGSVSNVHETLKFFIEPTFKVLGNHVEN
ncbi:unnamed protein product [Dibothriocephalus latus]|uniref:Uncharacterized protein n=1 Tax=Dibothriocephalus latus TaxID=60516 RepID=A0A3P7LIB0_DIBLA|nr:unnamed protein product [Dibothriocephalus latus]